MDFSIPLNKEDLLHNKASDGYIVSHIFEPARLGERMQECHIQSKSEGPAFILTHFDTFYSILHHMSRLKDEIKYKSWECLFTSFTSHMNSLHMILDPEGIDAELRRKELCILKMEVYLMAQFIEEFESEAAKPDINKEVNKKGKSSKKKQEVWEWSEERKNVLTALLDFLQLDIQLLWDPPVIEEEFVNLLSGVCYKMLENAAVIRQKEEKDAIFKILGCLIKNYNHQLGASMKIIQLLQHFEHLVLPLSQALSVFVTEFGAKNLIADVIREIGRMDSSDLSRDSSGTRSFSQFIVEIAEKIPNYVLPNISLLMSHLDGDSYTMRNGVLGVFGEIVIKILRQDDLDQNMKNCRKSFLDKLEEHIHDIHAFVRSKVLQIWLHLCHEKAIPISRQSRVIDLVIGRLHDKSSQVRKYSVQFLKASLIGNPFAAKLHISQLTESLEKEIKKLEEMNGPQEEEHSEETTIENERDEEEHVEEENTEEPMDIVEFARIATQAEPNEQAEMINSELEKQKVLVTYLKDCVNFASQMQKVIPILCQLLHSKTNTDVLETIDFFIAAQEFGLSQSEQGVRRMANLVWSRDPVVKKAVVNAFERLYIDFPNESRNKPAMIVQSLSSLIIKANLGELTSLEELVCELMRMGLIPQSVIQLLWQKFSLKTPQVSPEDQYMSIIILSMIAGAEKDVIRSNLGVLVEYGLKSGKHLLSKQTCSAIMKLVTRDNIGKEPYRLPSDHQLFVKLETLLVEGIKNTNDAAWIPFCEQALAVIYNMAESPDNICERILRTLVGILMKSQGTIGDEEIFASATLPSTSARAATRIVARVLSAAGHIGLLHLYHLDVSIFSELKRRHRVQEEGQQQKESDKRKNGRKSMTDTSASNSTIVSKDTVDDDMGVGGAQADDAEAEYIRKICEKEIVTGKNLLSIFAPVAVMICSNPTKYNDPELKSSAALALCKFMLISSEFCDKHLQVIFTVLEKSNLPLVRSNMIILLGDLCFRFPNLLEPWTSRLYARLRDDSVDVRKTTVTILKHLILNDMLKVKGQISEMAVCLEDPEERISSSAKMLFSELGRKGNALYNIAPDIISRLSDPETGVDEKMFRKIMKFILQFIQKDKQAESLVEKLCHRFRATRTDRQWRDLSFCLSVLPYNEKTLKKLIENSRCYHDKLSDEEVFGCFNTIISKCKKFAKTEIKPLIEEFESTIEKHHSKGMDEEMNYEKAGNTQPTAVGGGSQRALKKSGRTKNDKPSVNEDSNDDEDTAFQKGKENRKQELGKRRNTRRGKSKVKLLNPVFSSDDEDFFD